MLSLKLVTIMRHGLLLSVNYHSKEIKFINCSGVEAYILTHSHAKTKPNLKASIIG